MLCKNEFASEISYNSSAPQFFLNRCVQVEDFVPRVGGEPFQYIFEMAMERSGADFNMIYV